MSSELAKTMDDFRVWVRKNHEGSPKKQVIVKPGMNLQKFKKLAGKELSLKAKRVFLTSGTEVNYVDELKADDEVYISAGEAFWGAEGGKAANQEQISVSVLGTGGVGKSAITLRFVRDFFVEDWDPTIEDAYRKTVDVDDILCVLEILDTAGQDDFASLRPQWMMGKQGYVFVYSMDNADSLEELKPFLDLHRQINGENSANIPIILCANKKDIIDQDPSKCQVPPAVGRAKAEEMGALYLETSALNGEHVIDVFETIIRQVRKGKAPPSKQGSKCIIL